MYRIRLMTLVLLGSLMLIITPTQAQSAANNIYVVTSNQKEYALSVFDPTTGEDEILYSAPSQLNGTKPNLLPQVEIEAYNQFLPEYEENSGFKDFPLIEKYTIAGISTIVVSPDNQQVIVEVTYRACMNFWRNTCYGTTQLILIDRVTKQQKLLLNIGRHSTDYALDENPPEFYPWSAEVGIGSIQWTPNQQALIVGIHNANSSHYPPRFAIVVVPLDGSQPFRVGEGTIWTIAPTGNQIAVLSDEKDVRSHVNTLTLIDFDVSSGQSSSHEYSLRPYAIDEGSGIVYFGKLSLFNIGMDTSMPTEGGEIRDGKPHFGLTIFDPQTTNLSIFPPDAKSFTERLEATLDGTVVLAQTRDSTVSQVTLNDDNLTLQPLKLSTIFDWKLGDNGDILIQLDDYTYQFVDLQGTVLDEFSLAQIQALKTDEETHILAVDW